MKMTKKIISIPPYISTTWSNVSALHLKDKNAKKILQMIMRDGREIEIPHLSDDQIEEIFNAHSIYLEDEKESESQAIQKLKTDTGSISNLVNASLPFMNDQMIGIPLQMNGNGGIEGLTGALQHNEAQANLPDLPPEILNKISAIARIVGGEEALQVLPTAETGCNCLHCQIVRAIHHGVDAEEAAPTEVEEEVTEEDLKFRTWDIKQSSDKLYTVTNPLDSQEHYNVYLGEPVGCTCGEQHCEHIKAVLYS